METLLEPTSIRQISSNVSDQTNNPTCWAFSASRVTLKFIKSVLPELQTSSTDNTACDKYYNFDKFISNFTNKNRVFLRQNQIPDFFKRITSRKCGEKEYKNLCLFMFIYFKLTQQFGCNNGLDTYVGMEWFTENCLNNRINETTVSTFPEPYNSVALRIMEQFYSINKNKIFVNCISSNYQSTSIKAISNSADRLWYHYPSETELFGYIKKIIDKNLYLSLCLDLFGDGQNRDFFYNYIKNSPRPKYTGCKIPGIPDITPNFNIELKKSGMHAMTIVDYTDDMSFVIKNSWGENWGENGTITIPLKELMTHCSLKFIYLNFDDIIVNIKETQVIQKIKRREEEDRIEKQEQIERENKKGGKRKTKIKKRRKNKTKKRKNKTKRRKNKNR
jgi:hypothetical protein